MKKVGIVLIVLQIIAFFGNFMYGIAAGVNPFEGGIPRLLGSFIFGIIGIILLIIAHVKENNFTEESDKTPVGSLKTPNPEQSVERKNANTPQTPTRTAENTEETKKEEAEEFPEEDYKNFENAMKDNIEELFLLIQKDNLWFTQTFMPPIPPLDLSNKPNNYKLTLTETFQFVFGKIFGGFGIEQNLDEAESICSNILIEMESVKPTKDQSRENSDWMAWQYQYAGTQIQLGTVYAFKKEYVKAVYHFLLGLKAEAMNLFMFYCDYIRFCIDKLPDCPTSSATYDGYGFSANAPMGCVSDGLVALDAQIALTVIPDMEGNNGEVLVVWNGQTGTYGKLVRRGSTYGSTNFIDIYETLLIDKDYSLKKVQFFFNGYRNRRNPNGKQEIRVADGFHVKPHSRLKSFYSFTEHPDTDKRN